MKKTALLALVLIGLSGPSMARSHHVRHHHYANRERSEHHYASRERSGHRYARRERTDRRVSSEKPANSHANITCEMVRAYVAQAGLVQARAMAKAAGMTASEERRAKRCLESGA